VPCEQIEASAVPGARWSRTVPPCRRSAVAARYLNDELTCEDVAAVNALDAMAPGQFARVFVRAVAR